MSWQLLTAMAATALMTFGVTYLPATERLFSFTALSGGEVGLLLLALLVYFLAFDALKVAYFKFTEKKQAAQQPVAPVGSQSHGDAAGPAAGTVPLVSAAGSHGGPNPAPSKQASKVQ